MKEILKKIIPLFLLSWYHFLLAFLGAIIYYFPSRRLKVIGVTGTNGKTTVAEMISKILEEAGYKVALMNSIRFKIGEQEKPNILKMTMPGRFEIQRFLKQAVNAGGQYAVLEVTSEGIKQHRHRFIDFDVAVFTNLAPEHIEAHAGFENYKRAKGKLFQTTKNIHIINLDDENAQYFLQFPAKKKYTYGLNQGDVNNRDIKLQLSLIGDFNIYNALAAICVGISQGISLEACQKSVEKIKGIPGRMEEVISQPFKVFVDYAFTPNALEQVYQTLANLHKLPFANIRESQIRADSRMICVLGACGGGRDKWKRPVLGQIAAKYCDEVIVTNEDPYDEDPREIINQVAQGIGGIGVNQRTYRRKSASTYKILDRREAIHKALEIAGAGDVVVITGKGSEPWMCVAGGKKIAWDDRQIIKEEFQKIYGKTRPYY